MEVDNQEDEEWGSNKGSRRTLLIRLVSVSFIVMSLISYMKEGGRHLSAPIPMVPLKVSADAITVPAIPASPGAMRGRDVILVTLDTTRPDRLGCYGNDNIKTPTLDRLAAEGVIFSNAIATASATLPTHASIFTGLYPHHHGARANGVYVLAEEHRTIAEMLRENDYDTAAFVSAFVLAKQFGVNQGFSHYDDEMGSSTTVFGYAQRRGDDTTRQAIEWLETKSSRPYFLWVHYFDPHHSLEPPAPFLDQNPHPYDGEIAFMDHELGRLLDKVKATSKDEPLIIIVADHAESLGEHGERTHSYFAYEATLRIPFIMHAPGVIGSGRHVNTRVSQVDILPTIASLLGLEVPQPLDGVDLTQALDPDRAVIAEAVEGQARFGWAGLAALYRGSLKYIDGPNPELFDLERDPLEAHNIFSERRREAGELKQQLQALRGENALLAVPTMTDLDEADVARLEALGYVVTAGQAFESGQYGPDPKLVLPLYLEILDLIGKVHTGNSPIPIWNKFMGRMRGHIKTPGEAIAILEAMADTHPDFAPVYRFLGFLYKMEKRPDDVARVKKLMEQAVRASAEP
ncbi:MAG: sulfatase-like hydrolase/transferase [Myxococcales bacterium]|nr:sulfatase-like hydrolase/transferase [Myxococcales bacterium]